MRSSKYEGRLQTLSRFSCLTLISFWWPELRKTGHWPFSLPPPLASSLSFPLPLSLSHRYPLEVHNVVLISPRLPQENSSCVCVCELLLPACDSAQCICVFVCIAAFNPFVCVCVCVCNFWWCVCAPKNKISEQLSTCLWVCFSASLCEFVNCMSGWF